MKRYVHQVEQHKVPVAGLEALSLLTEHSFSRHSHDRFGIGVFTHGAQRSWSHIGKVDAAAGNVIMVNPGEIHDGAPLHGPRGWQMLYIDPLLVEQALPEGAKAEDIILRPVVEDPRLNGLMARMFSEIRAASPDGGAVEEAFLLCLMQISRRHLLVKPPGEPGSPGIALAKEYLDDAPENKIILEHLAALCGISRFQLIRGFARATGITPHAYLIQSRVRLARRLLAEGNGLAEAALMAGFADQSHFTRAFLKQFGMTPGYYLTAIG